MLTSLSMPRLSKGMESFSAWRTIFFHRSTIQVDPTCYLQDLFTKESVRGGGVGRALIEAVFEVARVAGSPRVYWLTHETNLTAMKLYDKVAKQSGFVVYRKQI
jgi:GNAT superfamily N-acetyltransferase